MIHKKLVICLDIDDVLRNFYGKGTEIFLREHPQYTKKDIKPQTTWRLSDSFPVEQEYLNKFFFGDHAKELYTTAPVLNDALEQFNELKAWCEENGHRLVLISSQPRDYLQLYTIQWLLDHGFDNRDVCIVRGDKTLINGDYLLDDAPHNLTDWDLAGRTAVCMDQAWNQDWDGPRVTSISQYLDIIKEHLGTIL